MITFMISTRRLLGTNKIKYLAEFGPLKTLQRKKNGLRSSLKSAKSVKEK